MAITATLSVDRDSITAGLPCRFTLVVATTSTSPVNILDISMTDSPNNPSLWGQDGPRAALAMGQTGFAPSGSVASQTRQIPASGSVTLGWAGSYFSSPQGPRNASQPSSFSTGVIVRTDDGSVTASNTLTIACSTAFAFNTGVQSGAYPQLPVVGQGRFDLNITGSPMVAVLFPGAPA